MRYIVIANVALYFLNLLSRGSLNFLELNPAAILRGEVWRVVTYALLPASGGIWLLVSCVFYYWLGGALESIWGSAKFTLYYVSGVLLSAAGYLLVYLIDGRTFEVAGATYVNTALFLAYALYNPDAVVRIYFLIPIKMKWLAWFEVGLYAVDVILNLTAGLIGMALLPVIALLNLFVFFAPLFHSKLERTRVHNRPQAIQFRKAVREQKRQQGYNHRCTVCGRTDTEFPELQFRYCSKCVGYHCFCEDHIFNHTHFTE